jgi:5-methylcytosine-specific restriction endonuclease McrA
MIYTPITLKHRKSFSTKERAALFVEHGGLCHLCGGAIQAGQTWDVDHVIPLALGGTNDTSNLRPAHSRCHRGTGSKTSDDVKDISRADRLAQKHFGIRKPKGRWPKRSFPKA